MVPASAQLRVHPERKDGGHPTLCNAPPQWLRMRHQSHQSMDIDRKGQADHLSWQYGHFCHMLQVTCRFAACRMLNASHCLLLVIYCRLHAVCFNSQCCNSGRHVTYVSCFLYLASAARRMLRAAYCVLQVACRLMYSHVVQYWATRYIPLSVSCLWLLA